MKQKPVFLLLSTKPTPSGRNGSSRIIERYKDLLPFKEIIPIPALTGINVAVLETCILQTLPRPRRSIPDDEISDQSERFLLAEIIREKVLNHVEKELPFETAVYIDDIERKTRRQ